MSGGIRCTMAAAIALIVLVWAAPIAQAQAKALFDLPAQPLADSLRAVGSQTNTNLLFDPPLVAGRQAPALKAEITADEALTRLLVGTGIKHEHLNETTIVLARANEAVAKPGERRSQSSPKVSPTSPSDGEGKRKEGDKSFWDRFRMAQVDQTGTANGGSVDTQSNDEHSSTVKLEEIVVTAQKREERLIDTPQSVSVLSADSLAKLGATQFRDFANTVPGLNFQTGGAGFNQLSLRGVTTGYDITPSVGNVVDDVPYGSSSAFARGAQLALDVGLFDIDRIEVLRGPQGTLYGASTMGGLIKYVTKQPNANRFGVDIQTGISDTKDGGVSYVGAAAVNLPLVADEAAVRASGFYSRDGGYIDDVALNRQDVNRSNIYGGRFDLLLTPNDALTVGFGAVIQDISRDGTATSDYTLDRVPVYGRLDQFRLIPETFDQRFRLVSGTANYDFGPVKLTSVSSYQTIRSNFIVDDSPNLVPILQLFFGRSYSAVEVGNDVSTDKFTQEVRLASDNSGPMEWLIGGFYTHEISDNHQEVLLLDLARQRAPNDLFLYRTPSSYKEYAAFGDLTYRLTEKFDVTGGLRYARNDQAYTQIASGLLIGSVPKRTDAANVYTYLANARYHFSGDATGYVRYATGYRPGGPNAVSLDPITGLPNAPPTFKADTLKSYEAGFKAQNSAGTLGVDVAAYYIDWNDLQQLTTTASGVSYYANATAGATVKGSELTLTARPVRGFTATGALAYQDATMSGDEPILGANKGERLPNVPRFTAALTADYLFPGAGLRPSVGATFRSVSDRMSSFDNSGAVAQYGLGSYSTVDLRLGLLLGSIDLQLYIHNISDERGQLTIPSGVSSVTGPVEVSTLQPRTVGITATTHF
jgi:iron complex outermembrane receptor protein